MSKLASRYQLAVICTAWCFFIDPGQRCMVRAWVLIIVGFFSSGMTGKTGKNDGGNADDNDDDGRKRKRNVELLSNGTGKVDIHRRIEKDMRYQRARVDPAGLGGSRTQPQVRRWCTYDGVLPQTSDFSACSRSSTKPFYVSVGVPIDANAYMSSETESESEAPGKGKGKGKGSGEGC